MNRKQKIILWIGLSLMAVLAVYPPYNGVGVYFENRKLKVNLGHRNILRPIRGHAEVRQIDIAFHFWKFGHFNLDFQRLLLEWVLIGATTGGGLWAFKDKRKKEPKDD